MAENKEINLNKEEKAAKTSPSISTQKPLPQRPLPARPASLNAQKIEKETKKTKLKINKEQKGDTVKKKPPTKKVKKEKTEKKKIEKKNKADIDVKTPEQKKKELWKKIRFYSIISLVCVAVIGIALLVTILSIKAKENQPLVMQENSVVEVISFNGQYYLEVPQTNETFYYVFELTSNQTPVLIFSRINRIDVSEYFAQQATFTIRYYVQKISDVSRSQASASIEYAPQAQLATPVLRLNDQTDKLEWNYVLNAGSYMFYYASGNQILTYEYFPPIDDEDNIGSFMPELNYGIYNISIVAKPLNSIFYTSSDQSNIIIVNNFKTQEQVLAASYSLSNQTIIIDASNLPESEHSFAFHIGEQILYFSPLTKQDTYEINVTQHGLTISLGSVVSVVTLGAGEFLLDSEPKICVPQN